MAKQYRGLSDYITDFTSQYLIEDIQELCAEIYSDCPRSFIPHREWVSSRSYVDTKEDFGNDSVISTT